MSRLLAILLGAATLEGAAIVPFPLNIPLAFEENRGQSPPQFKYVVTHVNAGLSCDAYYRRDSPMRGASLLVMMRMVDANTRCESTLANPDGSFSRYYRGANQTRSIDRVLRYRAARFNAVWPGVDVEYTATSTGTVATLKLVRASVISVVRIRVQSASTPDAAIFTRFGQWPVSAEQNGNARAVQLASSEDVVSFTVPTANPSLPLILRIVIPLSMDTELTQQHTVDQDGNRYVAAAVFAYADLDPTAVQCYNFSLFGACPDAYVASFGASGDLRYVVYFLGARHEAIYGLTSDTGGNIFVTGTTYSKDFVTTSGAYQPTYAGPEEMVSVQRGYRGGDAFIAKLHGPTGGLIYSTYVGTAREESSNAITADSWGRVTAAVYSQSPDLPLLGEAVVENPTCCARMISLDESGSTIRYSLAMGTGQMKSNADGTIAMVLDSVPYDPTKNELLVVNPDGTLRYRRAVRNDDEHSTPAITLRSDGSLWMTRYRRLGPGQIVCDLYQVPADGSDPFLVAEGLPECGPTQVDESDGLWMATSSKDFQTTIDAPIQVCGLCGGLRHFDASGTLRFATLIPTVPDWIGVAAHKVYFWSYYPTIAEHRSYLMDELAPPGPVLTAAVDTMGSTAAFVPGNIVTLLGHAIGPQEEWQFPLDETGRAATKVGGTRVLAGAQECVILSTSTTRLVVLLPLSLAPGNGTLTVEKDGRVVAALPYQSYGPVPGILWGENAPPGLGIQNEDETANGPDNPARIGSVIKVYLVSVGATDPPAIEREVFHTVLPAPVTAFDFRFGMSQSGQQLAVRQSPDYVTGIYEVRIRLDPIPTGLSQVPLILGWQGIARPQWQLPLIYLR